MIEIVKPRSREDISRCIDMYLSQNDYSFLPADRDVAYRNLDQAVRRNRFVRMYVKDGEILGWIYGLVNTNLHSDERMLQQIYFTSNQSGLSAARIVKVLHEELALEAQRLGINIVVSAGSHLDEDNTFTKLLEKFGWERRGHIAVKKFN